MNDSELRQAALAAMETLGDAQKLLFAALIPKEPEHKCATCKYEMRYVGSKPCVSCGYASAWKPKEPEMPGAPASVYLKKPRRMLDPDGWEHTESKGCKSMGCVEKKKPTPAIRDDGWKKTPEFGDEVKWGHCRWEVIGSSLSMDCASTVVTLERLYTDGRAIYSMVSDLSTMTVTRKAEIKVGDCVRIRRSGELAAVDHMRHSGLLAVALLRCDDSRDRGHTQGWARSDLILVAREKP